MAAKSITKRKHRSPRARRHLRIRKKVSGTAERPRLVVFRSLRNIEGQLVDDEAGRTLLGFSTLAREIREADVEGDHPRQARARAAGMALGQRASEQGIRSVVFDRGGYKYHGRVKAFAEGAREGGLEF
ncbi:MAG: 50S ribosomal protein L18 [Longimicrobiales bacterium]|nr:50S ribosomal protein L18 [Longimicrobiales bacterium]